jgi:hypothetical protein
LVPRAAYTPGFHGALFGYTTTATSHSEPLVVWCPERALAELNEKNDSTSIGQIPMLGAMPCRRMRPGSSHAFLVLRCLPALVCFGVHAACNAHGDDELFDAFTTTESVRPNLAIDPSGGAAAMSPGPNPTTLGGATAAPGGSGGGANGGDESVAGSSSADEDGDPADGGTSGPRADGAPPSSPCTAAPERCDGIDNDCDGSSDEQLACPVPCIGFALEGQGYMFCSASVDRGAALATCSAQGMKLAWLETASEGAALLSTLDAFVAPGATNIHVQLGASDSEEEGIWRWVGTDTIPDGFQFWEGNRNTAGAAPVAGAYESWGDVEPNDFEEEDCGALTIRANESNRPGEWDDQGCEVPYPFVCEAP